MPCRHDLQEDEPAERQRGSSRPPVFFRGLAPKNARSNQQRNTPLRPAPRAPANANVSHRVEQQGRGQQGHFIVETAPCRQAPPGRRSCRSRRSGPACRPSSCQFPTGTSISPYSWSEVCRMRKPREPARATWPAQGPRERPGDDCLAGDESSLTSPARTPSDTTQPSQDQGEERIALEPGVFQQQRRSARRLAQQERRQHDAEPGHADRIAPEMSHVAYIASPPVSAGTPRRDKRKSASHARRQSRSRAAGRSRAPPPAGATRNRPSTAITTNHGGMTRPKCARCWRCLAPGRRTAFAEQARQRA